VRAVLLLRVAAAFRVATFVPLSAVHGLPWLANVPDRQRRDGFSQFVVRRKHAAASSRRASRNQRITRRRTRAVSAARSACEIGRTGRNANGEAAQPLRHGDHPLSHGHRGDDVIDEMGGGLRQGIRQPAADSWPATNSRWKGRANAGSSRTPRRTATGSRPTPA
jgi:hypothetical protein